jgi:lipoate-protein ligase B
MNFVDWGRIDYSEALIKQKELLRQRQENLIQDTFVFCEHPAVITLGRGKPKPGELPFFAPPHIPTVNVERGGLATYHGPGQLVCYPIVRLAPKSETNFPGGIVCFIRLLENWMIEVLKKYDVPAWSIDGKTGVWVGEKVGDKSSSRKIASIGVAVSHWVTYHGLAFNFDTGKNIWTSFNPCGLAGDLMTDLKSELVLNSKSTNLENLSYEKLKTEFIENFSSSLPCGLTIT